MRPPSKPLPISTLLAERYEIRDLLGRGGYAHVYLAWDHVLHQSVALKVLRSERVSPTSIQRFRRSVALARDLSSPNLARVFDVGRDGEHLFLAMEVLEGGTLADLLREGPLATADALDMAKGILSGLADLHRHGILHRDLKPANILIDPAGCPRIADFDFARLQDPTVTRATRGARIVGTLAYLSPEQALGDEVDERSDLYSAGLILFELLTGKRPYPGRSTIGSIVARLTEAPVDIRRTRKNLPGWLGHIVNRLLAARPEDRYDSAEAVLADFDREHATRRRVRHRRLGSRRILMLACSSAVVIAALLLAGFGHVHRERTLGITARRLPSGELIARNAKGSTVWRRDDAACNFIPAVLKAGASPDLVGVLQSGLPLGGRRPPKLTVLDTADGAVKQSMVLPATGGGLPQIAKGVWHASVRVEDFDHDGVAEILVTFFHLSSPFSYTVLIEPRIGRTRTIFASNQPGRYLGERDIDGDGTRELLFLTRSAPFDGMPALSAVRLNPGVDQEGGAGWQGSPAITPEQAWQVPDSSSLLWFSLLPESPALASPIGPHLGKTSNGVTLLGPSGARIELDRFGFLPGNLSDRAEDKRLEARRAVYRLMRKEQRAVDRNSLPLALDLIEEARKDAQAVSQATLSTWVDRREGTLLVPLGRTSEAEQAFDSAWRNGAYQAKTARVAGDAYLLAGSVEHALNWYQRGLTVARPGLDDGEAFTLAAHLTFAYQARGDLDTARIDLSKLMARRDFTEIAATLLAYLDWREDRPVPEQILKEAGSRSPLSRYWELEREWRRGVSAPANLLRKIREEDASGSEIEPLLLSLEAMITARLGDHRKAEALISKSTSLARELGLKSIDVRAHLDLIARRQRELSELQAHRRAKTADVSQRSR